MTAKIVALVAELRGITCRCGDPKRPKQTFCRTCYATLPHDKQKALYLWVGEGYEEAYADAVAFLDAAKSANDAKISRLKARA